MIGNGIFPHTARQAAPLYLERGLAPLPVPTRSKRPVHESWQTLNVTADTLDEYFPAGADLNIGVRNSLPDVDLDCTESIRAAALLLPPTGFIFGRQSAPRSHWIYRTDTPLATAQEKYTDLAGKCLVEMRGDGGQTVYPPSIHEDTGEPITWDTFTDPTSVPLDDLRRSVKSVAAAALLARHWPAEGSRDDAALALTGALSRAGWNPERVSNFVQAVAIAAGDEEAGMRSSKAEATARKLADGQKVTGWPRLAGLLDSGNAVVRRVREWLGMVSTLTSTAPTKLLRPVEPYRPFPVEALPAPIAEYVRQGALALGCDSAFLALPALAAVASVIGNTRTIRLKRDWYEPSVIWSVIVGDSGTLKSPAYLKAVAYLFRIQKKLLQEYREQQNAYAEEMERYQRAKREAKENKSDPPAAPQPPVYRRVVLSDITIQKLAEVLEDNPRGVLVARDELAGWFGSFKQFKGKNEGSDLPNWLEAFRAGTIIVDRKTGDRKHYFVERAAVSITGGIQPGVLARSFTTEFLDAGGGARIIMAMPPKREKQWSELEIAPEVEAAYQGILEKLLKCDFDTGKDGEPIPHALHLSADAKAAWVQFYKGWAKEQANVEGELAAAFSKLEGYAARFALLHHVVTCLDLDVDDKREVGVKSVEAGVVLCKWFGAEVRRIYSILTESEEESHARRLVEFVRAKGGRITAKQLQRSNQRRYPTAEKAEGALQGLVDEGAGQWEDRPATLKGGRPTRDFILSTLCDETDETPLDDDDGEGGTPAKLCDDTPPDFPGTLKNPAENEVSSVSSYVTQGYSSSDWTGPSVEGVSSHAVEVSSHTRTYQLVTEPAELGPVQAALDESEVVGLDVETTGLNARADRCRLLSLATERGTYLIDCFQVDPSQLFESLAEKRLLFHNGAFDLGFLWRMGFRPGRMADSMLLSALLDGTRRPKGYHGLAECVQRELRRPLDKGLQVSDWSGALSRAQLDYAALDVGVLRPLHDSLGDKIKAAGLDQAADIENRCLPALVWCAQAGIAFDLDAWGRLTVEAEEEAFRLGKELDAAAPTPPNPGMFNGWNWNSNEQVKLAFQAVGCNLESTDDDAIAKVDHPMAELLRQYRAARKKATTYGKDWTKHVDPDGRVYAGWKQLGADSGRMSCREPNLQNLPRDRRYRACFQAPPGRMLVKADYSQVELRIAAKISGDRAMLDAYQAGHDLHTLTARRVLGIDNVTGEQRQLAKALNFGLLYGMGVRGLQAYARANYGVKLSEDEAAEYRRAFFRSYRGLAAWHGSVRTQHASETRTLAGRRRLMGEKDSDTLRLNSPVQGTGADGLKLALALLWERRHELPGAFPVLMVHDEIVVECADGQAEAVEQWLKTAMIDAMQSMLDPVAVAVETKAGRTW